MHYIINEDDDTVEVGGCSLVDILEDIQDEFYEEYKIKEDADED